MENNSLEKHISGKGRAEQRQPSQRDCEADLEGWSTRVEDLVDAGDEDAAVQLLERVVEKLQIRSDARSQLGLAAALNDLGRIYEFQGHSLKSDEVFTSALLIKQRISQEPEEFGVGNRSRTGVPTVRSVEAEKLASGANDLNENAQLQSSEDTFEKASIAGATEEEDWETILDDLPSPVRNHSSKALHSTEKCSSKQRGRGSFTYGGLGMYSDNLDMSAQDDGEGIGSQIGHFVGNTGASHVLVLSFCPKTKTKDLEDLVKPFAIKGKCSIRWIDDTRALAVFSSPNMARDALVGIKDSRFKVSMSFECSDVIGDLPSVKDLTPPGPRPASSASVAQRMIGNALSRQGISYALREKTRGTFQETQKLERQRKERLHSRAQLRDEAWGSDVE